MSKSQPASGMSPEGLTIPEKVIQHITLTDIALQKAAAMEKSAAEKKAQVNHLIPQVVEALVKHERILPNQREKLAEMLQDPVRALELMMSLAGHRNQDELARLGQPTATGHNKTAGYNPSNSLSSPHVGARTTKLAESDMRLFAGLGMSSPSA